MSASDSERDPIDDGAARPRLHETSVELEVPLYHVDALGIVWHGRYYEYLEHARIKLLRGLDLDGRDLVGLGFGMLLIESHCRHVAPLRYGDRIRVVAWLRDVTHRLHVEYEIENLSRGGRAARAHTILVTTDADGRLLLRTPEAILARVAPGAER
jgi:acyl-CoA thioester hydrolase